MAEEKKTKAPKKPASHRYKLLANFVDSEKKKIWDDWPELSYVFMGWPLFIATDLYRMLVVKNNDTPPLVIEDMLLPADLFSKVGAKDVVPEMVGKYLEVTGYKTPEELDIKRFPDYSHFWWLLRDCAKATVVVGKEEFIAHLKTCSLTSEGVLELELCGEYLTLRTEDKNAKTQLHMEVGKDGDPEDFCIQVNMKFLEQAVGAMPTDSFILEVTEDAEEKLYALRMNDPEEDVTVFLALINHGTTLSMEEEEDAGTPTV